MGTHTLLGGVFYWGGSIGTDHSGTHTFTGTEVSAKQDEAVSTGPGLGGEQSVGFTISADCLFAARPGSTPGH